MGNKQRLDKVLSNCGLGTRKEAREYIKKGFASVNGKIEKSPETHVEPETDEIFFKGEKLKYKKFIYIMMNKPAGVLTAARDKRQRTIFDILPDTYKKYGLSSVGRLDKDTEGLLVLTNDGEGLHELISPKKHVDKVYFAELEKPVNKSDVTSLENGVNIGGYVTMPAKLEISGDCGGNNGNGGNSGNGGNRKVYLTIHEGKYHQVKRMFEALGNKVVFLKRISIGKLKLDPALKPGEIRELTEQEINFLYI